MASAIETHGAVYFHQLDVYVTERVKELTKGKQHLTSSKTTVVSTFPLTKP